jgi:hypothetical protein
VNTDFIGAPLFLQTPTRTARNPLSAPDIPAIALSETLNPGSALPPAKHADLTDA